MMKYCAESLSYAPGSSSALFHVIIVVRVNALASPVLYQPHGIIGSALDIGHIRKPCSNPKVWNTLENPMPLVIVLASPRYITKLS
jgi:hypothetical protein